MNRLLLVLTLVPLVASAGKEERDFKKRRVDPAVADAEAAYASRCGCPLKLEIDASLKTVQNLLKAESLAEKVKSGAASFCTDAAAKKAACRMKTLTLKMGAVENEGFVLTGADGVITCGNDLCSADWDMIAAVLDT